MEPEDQSAAQEMAEVRQLQRQQLTSNIGVPGLQIEELQGELQLFPYRMLNCVKAYFIQAVRCGVLKPNLSFEGPSCRC